MDLLKKYKNLIQFYLLINVIFALFVSLSSYVHVPLVGWKDTLSYVGHFILLQFSLFGFIYLATLNKWLFYFVFIPIFLLLSIIAFFGYSQDIALSAGVIQASLETKTDVVVGLLSWQLVGFVLLSILAVIVLVKFYKKIDQPQFNYVLTIVSILSLLTFFVVESKRKGTLKNRLPYTLYFETKKFIEKPKIQFETITEKFQQGSDSLQIIFILGESVRADHLALNGYERNTNPKLSQLSNLISFPNGFTNNTYTGSSVPQILSDASVNDHYLDAKISLIDVLNQTQIPTTWIGNQTPENSYFPFIKASKQKIFVDPSHSEFSFNKEFDEVMLPHVKSEIHKSRNQFLLVHMMGSHWYYENRYPDQFRVFQPTITSKYIPSNSPESMVNSYDNTLLYLDFFVDEIIQMVKSQNTNAIVLYVSDHGELLGEDGKWLHAQPGNAKAVRNPAVLVWYSDKFAENYPEKISYLKQNQAKHLPLDFVFHTILDLYEINYPKINSQLSLFSDFNP